MMQMKMTLRVIKDGTCQFEGVYEVADADSFGKACADVWMQVERRGLDRATSVGAFMDIAGESVADRLAGAAIELRRGSN